MAEYAKKSCRECGIRLPQNELHKKKEGKRNYYLCDPCNEKAAAWCFIATATLGDYNHPVVLELRNLRDNWILEKSWGNTFVRNYYFYGSILSEHISSSIVLKRLSYYFIVLPLYLISKILLRNHDQYKG
jgi:hypothetical protein